MKLKYKIILLVVGILSLSLLTLSFPLYWYTRSALEDELDRRLMSILEYSARTLDTELITALIREPSLASVRQELEALMDEGQVGGINGMLLYSRNRQLLAATGARSADEALFTSLIGPALEPEHADGAISDIYDLGDGEYLKTAALSIYPGERTSAVLMVYGEAEFMGYIDQLLGTVFWVSLISLIVATGLTLGFSHSLVKPVQKLSAYAASIQHNLQTKPVRLNRKDEFGDLNKALIEMHTEIKENEKANKQLLSGIAHEIKNPLGGMEIYTGLLREEIENGSLQKDYIDKIASSLHTLNQTVISYLDFARPPKSNLTNVQLQDVVTDIFRILQPELKHNNIDFHSEVTASLVTDESKIRRVLLNIMQNCIQAVTPGKGELKISSEEVNTHLEIIVTDNGSGIPAADIDKIFQPYYTTREKGHGLGLAIAKNIVDELDGSIFVESTPGEGTCFRLRFDRKKDDI